jgi:hypothetical protein
MLFAFPLRRSERVRLPEFRMPSEILVACHNFVFDSGDQHSFKMSITVHQSAEDINLIYFHSQPNTTNNNSVYYLCSLQQISADFYGHRQVAAQFI